jgi:hypothetical protein
MVNIGTAAQFYGSTFFYDGITASFEFLLDALRYALCAMRH